MLGKLKLRRLVGKHSPTTKRFVFAGFAINGYTNINVFTVFTASRRCQCGFDCLEYNFFVYALLIRDDFNDIQNFFAIHSALPPST